MRRLTNCVLFMIVLMGVWVANPSPATAQAPIELRCENATNPKGIKAPRPQLSWAMNANVTLRGFQVLVASSEEKLKADEGDLWDSGKVVPYAKTVQYRGKPLSSLQRCYWKVRIWGNYYSPTWYSEPATWQMGVLVFDGREPK